MFFSNLSYSDWTGSGTNQFEFNLVRIISDSVYIGSIRVRVSSDSIQVISDFGSILVITISGWFGFRLVRIEIDLTLSHVGSGLISGCSI